jgi:hypothetical protein
VTAPLRRLGPVSLLMSSFKYSLCPNVHPYLLRALARDNLVPDSPSLPITPLAANTGSGKETTPSMIDLVACLDRLEELMHTLTTKVGDIDQHLQSFSVALIRIEHGWRHPRLMPANGSAMTGNTSDNISVVPQPHGDQCLVHPLHR